MDTLRFEGNNLYVGVLPTLYKLVNPNKSPFHSLKYDILHDISAVNSGIKLQSNFTLQCEEEQSKDTLEVYGSVTCKAEIDGVTSDITFNISYLNEGLTAPLDNLVIHHCVQSVDSDIIQKDSSNVRPLPRRIRFLPPYDVFTLCQYTVTHVQELPIFGVYKMKTLGNNPNDSFM
ncbi:hypothetical protein LOTGIDRAFT_154993 [Lottia gigantea]|uniref:AP-5 complex subunit mu-1 n=1 Tax=Lottia gigantea TaxID=225164 RepID=V3ZX29_LOTGI|nr:hypothetical protein LOTGIDRAFT_154993 [Lottia gigantea]ESO85506.1 hypothetical protein LOTGIDRAFT_154993 [Lottia gigantea]